MMDVHVVRDYALMRFNVYIFRGEDENRQIMASWDPLEWVSAGVSGRAMDYSPSFTIPEQAAHELLHELARELGAVEHPEQLRRDYMDERKRVDKFIDAAISVGH